MSRSRRFRIALAIVAFVAVLAARPAGASAAGDEPIAAASTKVGARTAKRAAAADSLLRYARAELAPRDPDHRRLAIAALEQAARLEPADPKYTFALGEAYFEAEFTERAQSCFERVRDLEPQSAEPYLRLGETYKRQWIDLLDRESLDHAMENFWRSAELDSERCDAWVALAPLLFEVGAGQAAAYAAQEALQADPEREDALLAAGYLAYRSGSVVLADSLLSEAVARMSPTLRDRFEDISPLVPDADTLGLESMSPAARTEWLRRFWSRLDPDPTTPANEARLEYWSRVAHATLLFSDRTRTRWDMRAQLYVRYGAPTAVARDPYTLPLWRKTDCLRALALRRREWLAACRRAHLPPAAHDARELPNARDDHRAPGSDAVGNLPAPHDDRGRARARTEPRGRFADGPDGDAGGTSRVPQAATGHEADAGVRSRVDIPRSDRLPVARQRRDAR